jgi:two-component system, response regulator PdtaR
MMNLEMHPGEPNRFWLGPGHSDPLGSDPKDEAPSPATGIGNLKVLIVEDEFFIALDAQTQIESLGCTVVGIAVSADEAITIVEREAPDIVLMDIRLQGVTDGIDAAREIRTRFSSRIIFVTANTDPSTRARAHAVQPTAFLEKPLTPLRLKQALFA